MAEPTAPAPQPPRRFENLKWMLQTLAMPVALVTLPLLYQWKAAEQADKGREERAGCATSPSSSFASTPT